MKRPTQQTTKLKKAPNKKAAQRNEKAAQQAFLAAYLEACNEAIRKCSDAELLFVLRRADPAKHGDPYAGLDPETTLSEAALALAAELGSPPN